MLPTALRIFRDGLLGLGYPQECRVCGGAVESWDDGVACAQCWDDPSVTKLLSGPVCARCGSLLSPVRGGAHPRLCGVCESSPFAAARACGLYSGAFEASVLFLKVSPHICPRLRLIIQRTFSEHRAILESEIVIPVPLHRLRERQRGFNQAAVLGKLISRKFSVHLDEHSLVRTKPTERHRAGMDATDRAQSVERAFEVARPRLIEGARVLLVDDVYTTGSTIRAAASKLLEAGAACVKVMTIARVEAR